MVAFRVELERVYRTEAKKVFINQNVEQVFQVGENDLAKLGHCQKCIRLMRMNITLNFVKMRSLPMATTSFCTEICNELGQDHPAFYFFFETPTVFPRRPVVFVC